MSSRAPAGPPPRTAVAVVGAGPTGLAPACALAARGIEFVILDRAATGRNTSRAGVVYAPTLEVLEDIQVTAELLERGVVVPRFTIKDRDRTLLTVPFDRLPTKRIHGPCPGPPRRMRIGCGAG
jgi:2-polyprenyl-6-methoxyphenol hydroxylase-like FAD-dependent oxidoreductase